MLISIYSLFIISILYKQQWKKSVIDDKIENMYITCLYLCIFIIHNIALFVKIIDNLDVIGLQSLNRHLQD